MNKKIFRSERFQRGATIVETAIVVALIAMVCVIGVQRLGKSMLPGFCRATDGLDGLIVWELSRDTGNWQCMTDDGTDTTILY